ncbi:MAG: helix-turn-helix transcriptional regulator [Clostridiales bacterium]|jgi:DNA-binding XRE family transcriptional regulator|nr:helix-turn-helix transcriptional regulator [Clostridiales bacterium]MDR2750957.1 helix-turn-helix transcriptional regulator [Clostridiales bacterium]
MINLDKDSKAVYIGKMTESLPVLRATLNITQQDLGECVGVTRQTIAAVENRRRPLTWSLFLALLYIFEKNERARDMMRFLKVIDE